MPCTVAIDWVVGLRYVRRRKRQRAGAVQDSGAGDGMSASAKRLGLRREAKRHVAFERTRVVGDSLAYGARESAVAAALCRRSPRNGRA